MPLVKVKENEPVDIAIRRFKRACEKQAFWLTYVKKNLWKTNQERKRKKAAAVKRYKKKVWREQARTVRKY